MVIMRIVRAKEYRTGFVVDAWDLERLVQALGGDGRLTRITAELGDGTSATLDATAEAVELPVGRGRAVRTVTVESLPPTFAASDPETPTLVVLHLRDAAHASVAWHVSGEEKAVFETSRQIEDWVDSVRPWYGRLAGLDRPALALRVGLGAAIVAAFGTAVGLAARGLPARFGLVPLPAFALTARIGALVALLLLLGLSAALVIRPRSFFPVAVFSFGRDAAAQGAEVRHAKLVRFGLATAAVVLWAGVALGLAT
jgi:hypothetical protein